MSNFSKICFVFSAFALSACAVNSLSKASYGRSVRCIKDAN